MKNVLIASMCLFVMAGCTAPEEDSASNNVTPEASSPSGEGEMQTAAMVTCSKCGEEVPKDHASEVDGAMVCAHCNPVDGEGDMETVAMVTCDVCGMQEKETMASVVDGKTLCSHCQ